MLRRLSWCSFLALSAVPCVLAGQEPDTGVRRLRADERKLLAVEAVRFVKHSQAALDWSPEFYRASSRDVIASGRSLRRAGVPAADTGVSARLRADMQSSDFTVPGSDWSCGSVPNVPMARATCALKTVAFYVEAYDPRAEADTAHVVVSMFSRDTASTRSRVLHHSVRFERLNGEWRAVRSVQITR